MPLKFRRQIIATGGIKAGTSGSALGQILYGTVSACVPAITASGDLDSGSISIPGVGEGDAIILTPANSSEGVVVYSACCTAADTVTASYCSATGGGTSASTLKFHYISFAA